MYTYRKDQELQNCNEVLSTYDLLFRLRDCYLHTLSTFHPFLQLIITKKKKSPGLNNIPIVQLKEDETQE